MKFLRKILALLLFSCCAIAANAFPMQYQYSGTSLLPVFTIGSVQNRFTSADSLVFSFITSSALMENSTYSSSVIESWYLGDGIYSYGSNNGKLYSFQITTDSSGNIAHWDVVGEVSGFVNLMESAMFSIQSDFNMLTIGYSGHFWDLVQHTTVEGAYGAVAPNIGIWTQAKISNVPEPSIVLLILTSLALMFSTKYLARQSRLSRAISVGETIDLSLR